MARCLPSILCIPRHFAAFSPQLVLPKPSSDTILSGQPNRHRAQTSFDSPLHNPYCVNTPSGQKYNVNTIEEKMFNFVRPKSKKL
ncbi:BTE_collapsed_G0005060.mRNA.1.CDS.1 [Saccharomyces cerevisiae]|nr:BTE_collapsed_G0005060.mRNA.1.CDS.1 [Saccharomyces cerevisiae]